MTNNNPLTVVGLQVENFKRVQAVNISPDPEQPIVAISGKNAQGKSSVIDAIWAALAGAAATRGTKTTKPVKDGADKATVRVDLGDLIVTRTWNKAGKSTLTVTNADGAKYSSPQAMLDDLIGTLTFDPLAFTRLTPRDQVAALMEVVDLDVDLDALDTQRAALYDKRTEIGRDRKKLGDAPEIDYRLPEQETPATELLDRITAAQNARDNERAAADQVAQGARQVEQLNKQRDDLDKQIAATEQQHDEYQANLSAAAEAARNSENPETLRDQLADLDRTNAAIRYNNAAKQHAAQAEELDKAYATKTDEIAALDKAKADALAAAAFPLDGLSFGDDGVTYNGQPLGQASAAEQLRAATAIAAALNPTVRVIRIADGSLLDSESRAALEDMARAENFQIWLELVDETGELGVVIEDGKVKN